MTKWEEFLDRKVRLISKSKIIVDIGGAKPFQKELSPYEPLFKNSTFVSIDYNHHFSPSITADIHKIPLKTDSTDAIICKAVLEHVYNPFLVVKEMRRVAKNNAPILVYVPFLYPYHASGNLYKDYYRFSDDGLKELFKNWKNIELQHVRGYFETLTNFLPPPLDKFGAIARVMDSQLKTPKQTSGYYLFARAKK